MSEKSTPNGSSAARGNGVIVRKHYDLLYWWVVWAYAGLAWLITWMAGVKMDFGSKKILFYEGAWLGVGFAFVLLFVAIFTSIRARGAMSAILLLVLILAGLAIHLVGGWGYIITRFPDLRVHMNQAFYGVIFCVLFPTWVATTFVFNRMNYFIFHTEKRIQKGRLLGGGGNLTAVSSLSVKRLDDDIFIHRILGLWWLGLGTGDLEVTFTEPGQGTTYVTIPNVWRVDDVLKRYRQL